VNTIALMYHQLGREASGPGKDPHYTVDLVRFSQQLAICQRMGGGVINTHQWLDGKPGVIITFDDGHESDYAHAFPTLASAKTSADFFINPRQVGTPGYATWKQLREMAENGMSIQSHGLDHAYFLTDLPPARLREELIASRREIEDRTGKPVTLLAPPGGRCPADLIKIAVECGYTHVLSSKPGRIFNGHGRELQRMAVTAQLDDYSLESWLRGGSAMLRAQVRYGVLDLAKRALGDDTYRFVRQRLLKPAAN
jgi:peptidoglycan/xylan/chitin deacetylase (PgdA/CDA1 family)